jgi:hypothetical protein
MITQITTAIGSGLSGLMNLVPTPGKLTIISVSKYDPVPIPTGIPPYVAMFNPENWQIQEANRHNSTQALGENKAEQRYVSSDASRLSFDLIIDGTGASGEKREVLADVAQLRLTTGFNGDEHRNNKFFIIWGSKTFRGVLESMTVKYTLFRPNGTPLRATVTMAFVEDVSRKKSLLEANLQSADLTHQRRVLKNDRLDLLCYYVYRDSRHYMEVARANGLTTFRKLPEGQELIYPPVEK